MAAKVPELEASTTRCAGTRSMMQPPSLDRRAQSPVVALLLLLAVESDEVIGGSGDATGITKVTSAKNEFPINVRNGLDDAARASTCAVRLGEG